MDGGGLTRKITELEQMPGQLVAAGRPVRLGMLTNGFDTTISASVAVATRFGVTMAVSCVEFTYLVSNCTVVRQPPTSTLFPFTPASGLPFARLSRVVAC